MTFIKSIINDSNKILLKKYGPPAPELLISDEQYQVAFVDTETTGIDRKNDHIIEIAVKVLCFETSSGKILSVEGSYESFNDPERTLVQR